MKTRLTQLGSCAASLTLTVLAGCASAPSSVSTTASTVPPVGASDPATLIRAQRAESEVARLNGALSAKSAAPSDVQSAPMDTGLLPPNAKPGECYARVLIPGTYETSTQQVVKRPASERVEIIPARYEPGSEQVLVREASVKLEVVPAVYEETSEQVLVRPAATQLKEIPARYESVEETVLTKAAYTTWKRGPATTQAGTVRDEHTSDTGEIMCLVEVPAVYQTVKSTKLVAPASTQEITIPAEYKTVMRRVIKTPATTRQVEIPAEYNTVSIAKLASPASEKHIPISAEYQTLTTRKQVTDAHVQWRQILCVTNQTPERVMAIQKALKDAGEQPGAIDGVIGSSTLTAANAYAASHGLETGSNYITLQVVRALKVNL